MTKECVPIRVCSTRSRARRWLVPRLSLRSQISDPGATTKKNLKLAGSCRQRSTLSSAPNAPSNRISKATLRSRTKKSSHSSHHRPSPAPPTDENDRARRRLVHPPFPTLFHLLVHPRSDSALPRAPYKTASISSAHSSVDRRRMGQTARAGRVDRDYGRSSTCGHVRVGRSG